MRSEYGKIEVHYKRLRAEKTDVEYKFPSEDTELATKFSELVGEGFRRCKEVRFSYLQAEVTSGGATYRSRNAASATKKETVMLLKFSGDKRTAYLRYPVWRKQWVSHIVDYEEKY